MAQSWLDPIFGADQVFRGGVVRRAITDVDKLCSLGDLLAEVRSRGFHLIETGDQSIVVCNEGYLKLHC